MLASFVASVIYGLLGLTTEVIFTGFYNFRKKFKGEVSLLMFPVYSTSHLSMTSLFGEIIKNQHQIVKYLAITLLIYISKYLWGFIFDVFKIKPWHYTHKVKLLRKYFALHINNRVNLVYLPFWFLFAILSWHYYENIGGILSKIW